MFKTLFFSIWFLFHPVHVTITSIDYAPELKTLKVFVRMYFDDFLRDASLSDVDSQNRAFSNNNSSSRSVMEKYLTDKVIIKVNEKQLTGSMKEMNLVDNEISMIMEYNAVKRPKIITVKNQIMTGLYSDISNMIIIRVNDFEEGVKLTADNPEQTFKIK